jgi:hypothetical protein
MNLANYCTNHNTYLALHSFFDFIIFIYTTHVIREGTSEKVNRSRKCINRSEAATWCSICRVSMLFSFNHFCFNNPYFNGFYVSTAGIFNVHMLQLQLQHEKNTIFYEYIHTHVTVQLYRWNIKSLKRRSIVIKMVETFVIEIRKLNPI